MKRSRIDELKRKILKAVGDGVGVYELMGKVGGSYSWREYDRATRELEEDNEIENDGGEWSSAKYKEEAAWDDLMWLAGKGCYAQ